jgi:hypothetical protein
MFVYVAQHVQRRLSAVSHAPAQVDSIKADLAEINALRSKVSELHESMKALTVAKEVHAHQSKMQASARSSHAAVSLKAARVTHYARAPQGLCRTKV